LACWLEPLRPGHHRGGAPDFGEPIILGLFRALAALRDDSRAWWEEQLGWNADDYDEGQTPYGADAESLRRFLEAEILPWCEKRQLELDHRPLIRAQAFGEAIDPHRLERLARYEVHLDRKLERMLAMLFKLKELRRAANPTWLPSDPSTTKLYDRRGYNPEKAASFFATY
jgi:hypothetical protein